jgi:hypothetical protein
MMTRSASRLLVVLAILVTSCGETNGQVGPAPATATAGPVGPATAQNVALQAGDMSSLKRCPQSGTYDAYLVNSGDANEVAAWTKSKSRGATEGYISEYADNTSDCGDFNSVDAPKGRLAFGWALKFKDASSATADYKTDSTRFNTSAAELVAFRSEGSLVNGTGTGLGENSLLGIGKVEAFTYYFAVWQNQNFVIALWGFNVSQADGERATMKINGRVH